MLGLHIYHHYDERYIVMGSAAFDTLSRPCAAGRSHVLQQKNILQMPWMFLPIYCNKTKKFNIQIFRKAFQPNK
jgi:hypothetical protein